MPRKQPDHAEWTERVQRALGSYAEPLARDVASRLTKPRIAQPVEDLIEKAAETLTNAIVVDRRLKELSPAAQAILLALGLSRQPCWSVADLVAISAARGFAEGLTPILELLSAGMLYPFSEENKPIDDLADWVGRSGGLLTAKVFLHPVVATRCRGVLTAKLNGKVTSNTSLECDGFDWPLRLAVVWQLLRATPTKMTQSGQLFKRDLTRLQAEEVLTAPFQHSTLSVPDLGVLAFEWAVAAELFEKQGADYIAKPFSESWSQDTTAILADLYASFYSVGRWDPLRGYATSEDQHPATATVALEIVCRLAEQSSSWHTSRELAEHLWENHPSFSAYLPKESHKNHGANWVDAFLHVILMPLRMVETRRDPEGGYRLTAFGRHLLLGDVAPPPSTAFPQTLMVQPNAEVILYRQGLTPSLIADLSGFAKWKLLGAACMLELNATETYQGLESGLSLAAIVQTLDRHSQRPVPPTISDLLRRWSNKRERITVYSGATLVEFVSPQDLETALARGIVTVKITDRIALTATGKAPEFQQLRLIGNRDYDAKPVQCVRALDDGVTLIVDPSQSDILLEAEIVHYAESLHTSSNGERKFQITASTLHRATQMGKGLEEIDRWFIARTGQPLSSVGRLFLFASQHRTSHANRLVVRVGTSEIADGLMQWPETSPYIHERLGPTAMVVEEEKLPELRKVLERLGMTWE